MGKRGKSVGIILLCAFNIGDNDLDNANLTKYITIKYLK